MPPVTRQQSKIQQQQQNQVNKRKSQPKKNHANIDFEDASKEWRKNKVKHENCHFSYILI
jgi:hypothetical protein